jgi:4-amino-4-deoxy-L-arabinose transferase-like glycosyltransferase
MTRALPLLVFAIAALFRFGALDMAAFTYDEADVILRARAVARGDFALAGAQTSWGVQDPPLLVYLHALVARLVSPPGVAVASLGLMALLNSLAVLATYVMVSRFFGRRCGLLAGLLYAVNPWAIYFGRRAWVEVQPLLTVLTLWAALEVVTAARRGHSTLFFVSLAAAVQARLLAVTYAPAALVTLLLGGRSWFSRWTLLGAIGGAALSLPYLYHLVSVRETIAAALAEGNRGVAAAPSLRVLEFTWWFSAGLNLLPTPPRLAGWLDALGLILQVESWLAASLLVGGLAICVNRCIRRDPAWKSYALLLAWTALPLGFVAWQSSTLYLHYLVMVLPLPFVLMALPLERLMGRPAPPAPAPTLSEGRPLPPAPAPTLGEGRREGARRWSGVVLFLAVALPQTAVWIGLQQVLATYYDPDARLERDSPQRFLQTELASESAQRIGTGESYGVEAPLRFWLTVAQKTRAELAAHPRPLLVATAGADPLADDRPARLEAVLGADLGARYQGADSLVVPLGRPALVLVTSGNQLPIRSGRIGRQVAAIGLPKAAPGDQDAAYLIDMPARSPPEWIDSVRAGPSGYGGDNGGPIGLSNQGRVNVGQTLGVLTIWQGPRASFRPSVVLLGPQGQRLVEREEPRRKAVDLAEFDVLFVWHELPVSSRATAGRYSLVVEGLPNTPGGVELGAVDVRAS